jgi:hypothetical protein
MLHGDGPLRELLDQVLWGLHPNLHQLLTISIQLQQLLENLTQREL